MRQSLTQAQKPESVNDILITIKAMVDFEYKLNVIKKNLEE